MPWLLYNQGASKRVSWLFVQHYKVAKYEYTLHCQQFLACCNSILRKLQVTKTELKKHLYTAKELFCMNQSRISQMIRTLSLK